MTVRTNEIESLDDFDARLAGITSLSGWFVQSVDLTERGEVLRKVQVTGAVFLGCLFDEATEASLRARGAMLFPNLPHLPFDPYRAGLYDADELYGHDDGRTLLTGLPYAESRDAEIYAWAHDAHLHHTLETSLAIALHDHSITDALDEATDHLDPAAVVGVMGGHAVRRGEPAYRDAMDLGAGLTDAGRTVLTGGGPGAMEAANLGAYLSPYGVTAREAAAELLAAAPSFAPSIDVWARAAFEVRQRWRPDGAGHSIGIPTWFYGHEPPNAFATEVAKYFTNALREDTLLARCRGGIVYLPGAAGTVQEIFQAVTENYYAAVVSDVAPLVLVDREHWTRRLPAWPLLEALGEGRTMGQRLHLVDSIDEALEVLVR